MIASLLFCLIKVPCGSATESSTTQASAMPESSSMTETVVGSLDNVGVNGSVIARVTAIIVSLGSSASGLSQSVFGAFRSQSWNPSQQ